MYTNYDVLLPECRVILRSIDTTYHLLGFVVHSRDIFSFSYSPCAAQAPELLFLRFIYMRWTQPYSSCAPVPSRSASIARNG